MTFEKFCEALDIKDCSGYHELKNMLINNIRPATLAEIERWETKPTIKELMSIPETKYLRFLHPNIRPVIIEHWDTIIKSEIKGELEKIYLIINDKMCR
jgi:hypothetical protein